MEIKDEHGVPIVYSSWRTATGSWGFVAVYDDNGQQFMKIVHNGVVRCFERIA